MFEEQKKSAVDKVKWVWWFLKEELPQFLSNWRTVTRLMMVLYGLVFYETMTWFMALEAPNNAQAVLYQLSLGQVLHWFGLYVNGKSSKIQKK